MPFTEGVNQTLVTELTESGIVMPEAMDALYERGLRNTLNYLFGREDELLRSRFGELLVDGIPLNSFEGEDGEVLRRKLLAFHKLLFLTGGYTGDVIVTQDVFGNYIYTKLFQSDNPPDVESPEFRLDHPVKDPEVHEATSSITGLIKQVAAEAERQSIELGREVNARDLDLRQFLGPFQLPEVISEIADVVFTLTNLMTIDPGHDYEDYLTSIAIAMDYHPAELLWVAYVKYSYRYAGLGEAKKNVETENLLIARALEKNLLPIPDIGKLSKVYAELNLLSRNVFKSRLRQLVEEIRTKVRLYDHKSRLQEERIDALLRGADIE